MSGLAIEAATDHVEVLVADDRNAPLAHVVEEVGHGHTRRLAPLVDDALRRARVAPRALRWIAADLGPGSFTGVRVGLASAQALGLAANAPVVGASSLSSLALSTRARRALIVPLVPAGRRDLYAGFYRADSRGVVSLMSAPRVGTIAETLDAVAEARGALGPSVVRFVGPGVARERVLLEQAWPGSTSPAWREEGLSALDLAHAARSRRGVAAGLPAPGAPLQPLYVRPPQAEEKVRRRALASEPVTLRPFTPEDVQAIAAIEKRIFQDAWTPAFFLSELRQSMVYARVAEHAGRIVGYFVSWLGAGTGHLGNLAVVPELRRLGVAGLMLDDLFTRARELGARTLTLEVRVSNSAAQALYRARGFRLVGLRRGYYRETGEDALVMEWTAGSRGGTR